MRKPIARPVKSHKSEPETSKEQPAASTISRAPKAFAPENAEPEAIPLENWDQDKNLPEIIPAPITKGKNWPLRVVLWAGGLLISLGLSLMLERLGPVESVVRSWRLVEGYWWRTFGIGLIFILLAFAATFLGSLLIMPLDLLGSSVLNGLASALISAVVAPFINIGSTVVYLDLRARQGGEDVMIVA